MGETRLVFVRDVAASTLFYREAFGVEVQQEQEIAFEVDDLDEAHARAVAAGAEVVARGVYRDPEGNVVSLSQRLRSAREMPAGFEVAPGN